jgi:hypothetical protein
MVECFLQCGFNHAVKWLKNILTGIEARLNFQQSKINSSLTNKTIQLVKHTNKTKTTQKTTNKII